MDVVGYDLHLTRTPDWTDSEQEPISLADWLAFARTSDALTETDEISTGDDVQVFLLGSDPRTAPALYWQSGRVVVRGADESHVAVLVEESSKLGVLLVGDDGELY